MSWQDAAIFAFLWLYHMTPAFLAIAPGLAVAFGLRWLRKKALREASANAGMTGEQMAQRILDEARIVGVAIEPSTGPLATFYDWQRGHLRLSAKVFEGNTVGDVAIAAHEAGHVLQPLWLAAVRTLLTFGLGLGVIGAWLVFAAGWCMDIGYVALIGASMYSALVAASFLAVPIEHDANRRVRQLLAGVDLGGEEKNRAFGRVVAAAVFSPVVAMWPGFGRGV